MNGRPLPALAEDPAPEEAAPLPTAGAAADPLREVEALQRAAADPGASVWVSANAGSGKTRVLVDRVARLLLAGAAPQKILCLTYTRAAAAEMQDRLFKTLGRWALEPEEKLRGILVRLGVERMALEAARRLFAKALETPGGLRLQTIHGFCESVLRRFPAETGLSPRFRLLDEEETKTLRREAAQGALLDLRASEDAADRAAASRFFREVQIVASGPFGARATLEGLAATAFAHREAFLAEAAAQEPPGARARLALGLRPGESEEALWTAFMAAQDPALLAEIAEHLLGCKGASKTDLASGAALKAALGLSGGAQRAALRALLLTQKGELRKKLMTKGLAEARPDLAGALEALAFAFHDFEARLLAFSAAARAEDFARFARRLIARYDAARALRGALDFEDLIAQAAGLFDGRASRAWALFKLDEGVDHILVDEAQDTSPAQWRVASALAEEFYVGESARGVKRTLFVVGDEKQSIYSFQGADPAQFDAQRKHFARLGEAARDPLRPLDLTHSFRSSPAILNLVDAVFHEAADREGLTSAAAVSHKAAFDLPGRVEWLPLAEKTEEADQPLWHDLSEAPAAAAPRVRLAESLAARIEGWIRDAEPLAPGGRAIRPGDVLVLVRSRDAFSRGLIAALKRRGLPVAGEDRIGLRASLAARDLLATARAALLPGDSLSLATALRSPVFGFAEEDLVALTEREGRRDRGGPQGGLQGGLWGALTRRRRERPHWAEAYERMGDLIARVDFLRPYEFLETILCGQDARRRLLKRLGAPAAEPVDELLAQALEYEAGRPPTLQGFVRWAESMETEIKRDLEQGSDEIRVMTAHGAKGLEAELVVAADSGKAPDDLRESRLLAAGEGVLWMGASGEGEARKLAQARSERLKRVEAEHRRLLYVALTRARTRLVVCGWQGCKTAGEGGVGEPGSWHHAVWKGMRAAGAQSFETAPGAPPGLALDHRGAAGSGPSAAPAAAAPAEAAAPDWPPDWGLGRPPADPAPPAPLAPSRLSLEEADPASPASADSPPESRRFAAPEAEAEAALDPEARKKAMERGLALHRILERFGEGAAPDPGEPAALVAQAEALTADPALAAVFQPGPEAQILSEAPLFGPLAALGGRAVSGSIDRLILRPDSVFVVDFKTGKPPEALPPGYLRQMAVYAAAAAELFPGRRVEAALLWLDAKPPRLDRLEPAALTDLLAALRARLKAPAPEPEADPEALTPDDPAGLEDPEDPEAPNPAAP